ncbi:MAG: outer membrane protein transport protein [Bacteroidota bacterium]
MRKLTLTSIILLATVVVFAQNGTKLIGFDAMSMGRAGTTTGVFDSYELMLTNPAGLSFLDKSSVNVNFSVMSPKVHFQNSLNDADGDKNLFPLPAAGYVHKSVKKDCKLTWGVGLFTQGGMGADFLLSNEMYRAQTFDLNTESNTYYPVKGAYDLQVYHSKFAVMQAGPSFAYKLSDKFSAGISIHAVYSSMEFSMPFGMKPSIMNGQPNGMPGMTFGKLFSMSPDLHGFGYSEVIASADMSDLSVISWGGKIGLAYKASDKLSFGFNYTMPTKLNYKNGKATMDMSKQFEDAFGRAIMGFYQTPGMEGAPLDTAMKYVGMNFGQMGIDLSKGVKAEYDLEVGMKLPMSLGYGMSYKATEKLMLALDVEWVNWAKAFDKMEIKLTNGSSTNVNTMIGSSVLNIDFPLKWKNTVIVKIGGEYAVTKQFTMRLGYAYGSNPVPEATVFPAFPAVVAHHVTIGASLNINEKLTLSAAIESALNNKVTATNPSEVQSEFNGSSSQLSTMLGHLSLKWNL